MGGERGELSFLAGCLGMTDLAALLSDLLGADVVWGNVRQTLSGSQGVQTKLRRPVFDDLLGMCGSWFVCVVCFFFVFLSSLF